jgi:hypothetical protein
MFMVLVLNVVTQKVAIQLITLTVLDLKVMSDAFIIMFAVCEVSQLN